MRVSASVQYTRDEVSYEQTDRINILRQFSHLPLPLRPKQIQTPQGNTIQPDVNMTERREKVLDAGRVVHEKLEKEVYPVQISVQTVTREDE